MKFIIGLVTIALAFATPIFATPDGGDPCYGYNGEYIGCHCPGGRGNSCGQDCC